MSLVSVQHQLNKFETAGVLVSRSVGKTRVFTWNPRFILLEPLRALLRAALAEVPAEDVRRFYRNRTRPRRAGKRL